MSETRFHFTQASVDAIPNPPQGKRIFYHDTKRDSGLSILASWTGGRVFYVYRWVKGRPAKVKIGAYPTLTLEQARKKAKELNAAIDLGQDPAAARRAAREEMTFKELFDWYVEHHSCRKKTGWRDEQQYRLYLEGLGKLRLSDLTRQHVRALHTSLGKRAPYAANRMLALVRSVFNTAAAEEQYDGPNPATGIKPFPEQSRERLVMEGEVAVFLAAVDQEPNETIRDYVYLSLFTGARKTNVLAMRWDQIDLHSNVWRIPTTKNGKPQTIPLGQPEVEVLTARLEACDGPWVFPGRKSWKTGKTSHMMEPKAGWSRILDRANEARAEANEPPIKDLRLHDLRRTLGSWMADTGSAENVIGKTLGHKSPQATAIYARLSLRPIREAKDRAIGALLRASDRDGVLKG